MRQRGFAVKNVNLNAGGIIGGVLGGALGAVAIWWSGRTSGRLGEVIIFAVVGGALVGNWIWSKFRPSTEPPGEATPAPVPGVSGVMPPPQRVYRMNGLIRWLLTCTILPLGCLIFLMGAVTLFSSGDEDKNTVVVASFLTGALFVVVWLWVFRLGLEIDDHALRLKGMLGSKEIPLSEVAGYTLEASGLAQAIKLVDHSGRCLGRIPSHLSGFPSILSRVEGTFRPKGRT
jgi:hypothetical protein